MSKLIVEMEIPKDCPMCPMAHYNKLDEFTGCEVAAGKLFAATRDKAYAESASRPSWCPIVGVLPEQHGDLIDRDNFKESLDMVCDAGGWLEPITQAVRVYCKKQVDAEKTIVPATERSET